MNIRKALLLVLIIAIASLGLTTGCEKKSDHPTGDHPATEKALCPKCGEVAGSEACCMQKAAEEAVEEATDAVKEAAAEHPTAEHPTEHPK